MTVLWRYPGETTWRKYRGILDPDGPPWDDRKIEIRMDAYAAPYDFFEAGGPEAESIQQLLKDAVVYGRQLAHVPWYRSAVIQGTLLGVAISFAALGVGLAVWWLAS